MNINAMKNRCKVYDNIYDFSERYFIIKIII